jgi:hypothetical protein
MRLKNITSFRATPVYFDASFRDVSEIRSAVRRAARLNPHTIPNKLATCYRAVKLLFSHS